MSIFGGLLSAGVGALGGIFGGNAAKKALKRSLLAYHQANTELGLGKDEASGAIESGYGEAIGNLGDYSDFGRAALGELAWGLGFDVPGRMPNTNNTEQGYLLNRFTKGDFETSPAYEFRRSEGIRGIERTGAARGSQLSGKTLKALMRWNQQSASQEYEAAFQRDLAERKFGVEALSGSTRVGQSSDHLRSALMEAKTGAHTSNIQDYWYNKVGATLAMGRVGAGNALTRGQIRQQALQGVGQGINAAASSFGSFFS